jgi:hypothetical protein
MDDKDEKNETHIKEIKTFVQTSVSSIEEKVFTLEKNTTWKISDCETLLKSRVNEKFV